MYWKAAILAAFLAFFAGFYLGGKHASQPLEPEHFIKTDETLTKNTQQHTQEHRKITTTIHKKNGDVVTRVEQDDEKTSKATDKQAVKSDVELIKPARAPKSKYALGLQWEPSISTPPNAKDSRISGGARLGDSNFFLEGGYSIKHNQFSLGVRYEW